MIKLKSLFFESVNDNEYYGFIKNNDVDSLKKIIESSAKNKGYNVGPVYHGTDKKFNNFSNMYSIGQMGFHVGTSKDQSEYISDNILSLYITIKNPLRLPDLGGWSGNYASNIIGKILNKKILSNSDRDLRRIIEREGYDGVVYNNKFEGDEGSGYLLDSYILFKPNQLKLSDLITYDDNKEIIPLSQRFDSSTDDIRY